MLAGGPTLFFVFVPLPAAADDELLTVVGRADMPEYARPFPLFRAVGARGLLEGVADDWWLWDGQREWRIGALSAAQRQLPIREFWNPALLVERLARGWRPENDAQVPPAPLATTSVEATNVPTGRRDGSIRHYLYFEVEERARKLAAAVDPEAYSVVVRRSADDEHWLVLVTTVSPQGAGQRSAAQAALEALARQYGGDYDGWEAAVAVLG